MTQAQGGALRRDVTSVPWIHSEAEARRRVAMTQNNQVEECKEKHGERWRDDSQ